MLSVLMPAFLIDNVKENGGACRMLSVPVSDFAPIERTIPQIIADITIATYKIIPSAMFPRRPSPMPQTRKAGPVLLQNPMSLSDSSFVIFPDK